MKATKSSKGKPPIGLIPWPALEEVAKVRAFGSKKYRPWDWQRGIEWSEYINASLRHILKFADGEDNASDSGLSHLAHAMCSLAFLITFIKEGRGIDDRRSNTDYWNEADKEFLDMDTEEKEKMLDSLESIIKDHNLSPKKLL
jgi:hypothetical protein